MSLASHGSAGFSVMLLDSRPMRPAPFSYHSLPGHQRVETNRSPALRFRS